MLSVSSNNKSLSSTSRIGSNDGLLVDILYCLPVKSLCVFKIVSKQWLSLIYDPYFERNYNLRSCRLSMPALIVKDLLMDLYFKTLVMDEHNGFDYVSFDIPIVVNLITSGIKFRHSCNGLVLCDFRDHRPHMTYVIYNPSTRCCKTLHSSSLREAPVNRRHRSQNIFVPHILSFTIAFDPAKSSYYQVVGVCDEDISKGLYHIEIYSSETDSWRDAGDSFTFSYRCTLSRTGVYSNGSVHWINQFSATLHYFDIDCESMKTVAIPTHPRSVGDYSRVVEYFKECRGHMHLMEIRTEGMPRVDIWEMRMDCTGWDAKYSVDLRLLTTVYPGVLLRRPQFSYLFDLVVLLLEDGEHSSRWILWIVKQKVISFDLKNKIFKETYHVNPGFCIKGFQYIETLARV